MDFQPKEKTNAIAYANTLLAGLNLPPLSDVPFIETHPAINNARSGVQGHAHPSSNNKIIPAALADYADGALLALKSVAQDTPLKTKLPEYGAHLLGERMALFNTHPGEQVSAGGSCHFFEARNGYLAINLARDEDFDLLPALTDAQTPLTTDKQIPRTVLVSLGSMIPSSLIKPVASRALDP